MSLFHTILADIKKKLDTESAQTETIARIASTVLGMTVTVAMVVQKGSHIQFKLPPTARTALILKRPVLLEALKRENIAVVTIA